MTDSVVSNSLLKRRSPSVTDLMLRSCEPNASSLSVVAMDEGFERKEQESKARAESAVRQLLQCVGMPARLEA